MSEAPQKNALVIGPLYSNLYLNQFPLPGQEYRDSYRCMALETHFNYKVHTVNEKHTPYRYKSENGIRNTNHCQANVNDGTLLYRSMQLLFGAFGGDTVPKFQAIFLDYFNIPVRTCAVIINSLSWCFFSAAWLDAKCLGRKIFLWNFAYVCNKGNSDSQWQNMASTLFPNL